MKLLLSSTSTGLSLLAKKLPRKGKGMKVLFSENAADAIPGKHFWVKNDRKAFEKLGCKVLEIDLRKVSKNDFAGLLKEADIIHFCGGSPMCLLALLETKGFATLLAKNVRAGKLIYTGTSAGSMISAKSVKLLTFDPDESQFVRQMKGSVGLGLTDFQFLPHSNQKDFISFAKSLIGHLPEHKQSVIFINDDQAVWVEGERFEILQVLQ